MLAAGWPSAARLRVAARSAAPLRPCAASRRAAVVPSPLESSDELMHRTTQADLLRPCPPCSLQSVVVGYYV